MTDEAVRATLSALAAEVGHELHGALSLFRMATDRLERGAPLDDDDVSLLREELERLTHLTNRLRALAKTPLACRTTTPAQLIEGAGGDGEDDCLEVAIRTSLVLECDPELMSLALRALLDNAAEWCATKYGVIVEADDERATFCVWDDGQGFQIEPARALAWGVSSKPGGTGMGLTLALRIARAHGFSLELRRAVNRTEAWLVIPARSLRAPLVD